MFLIKKEEELLGSTNPKHRIIGLMLKARRVKEAQKQAAAEEQKAAGTKEEKKAEPAVSTVPADYAPQRQDHCYMYFLRKKLIPSLGSDTQSK